MATYTKFTKDQRIEALSQRILQCEVEIHNMETNIAIFKDMPEELRDENYDAAFTHAYQGIKTLEYAIGVCYAEITKLKASAKKSRPSTSS